jgi:hypothetical protein
VSRTIWSLAIAATACLAGTAATQTPAPAALAAPAAPAAMSSSAADTLQEVTVTAKRFELAQRVSKFVYRIAALQNEEGLPRWWQPVCPLVGGLTRKDGEFVLERLSEIAREAGVPLAGETCAPNLFIVVNPDPQRLLRNMTLETRVQVFTGAKPSVVDAFIRTPQPVKAWYRTAMATPDGAIIGDANRPAASDDGYPIIDASTSYAKLNVIWVFAKVLVVVSQAQLRSVTRGQFADYVAMVGLANLKPGASLGDTPTIMTLFDGAPHSAPAALSDWDLAFLKSLYRTDQSSKGQRGQMVNSMVREVGR